MNHFIYFVAGWVFLAGLYGAVTSRNLIHLCICLSVVQSSTYVMLLGLSYKSGGVAPVFADVAPGTTAVDPVMQALMLTDIVVEATVIALLLALIVQIHKRTKTLDPDEVNFLHG